MSVLEKCTTRGQAWCSPSVDRQKADTGVDMKLFKHSGRLLASLSFAMLLPIDSSATEKFVLPKETVMVIEAIADANYTQRATITLTSKKAPYNILLQNTITLFYNSAKLTLPVTTLNEDVDVEISGEYLYTDTSWAASLTRVEKSALAYYVIGFDDSHHLNQNGASNNPDNDFNDLLLVIQFVRCDSVPNNCAKSNDAKCWEKWWGNLVQKPQTCQAIK